MTKLDYISDIHLLKYMNVESASRPHKVLKWINKHFWNKGKIRGDWLVIAGDLSEYNYNNFVFLSECSKIWKEVFFVFGNHDLWLSRRQQKNSLLTSNDKKAELKQMCEALENVHILDNEVVEIDGKTIAGSTNWYKLHEHDYRWWNSYSNDSVNIIPQGTRSNNERSKIDTRFLENLTGEIDLLITHIPPVHFAENKRRPNRAYYHPVYLNKNVKVRKWITGHQHTISNHHYKGIELRANCLGYPWENSLGYILCQLEI